jgi:DNA-directed RNA polymerase specialized sigma24 family protein
LSDIDRAVFVLVDLEEESVEQAATIVELTVERAAERLRVIHRELRTFLVTHARHCQCCS